MIHKVEWDARFNVSTKSIGIRLIVGQCNRMVSYEPSDVLRRNEVLKGFRPLTESHLQTSTEPQFFFAES